MPDESGIFTISLDFELFWGVRDKRKLENYGTNLRGVRIAIPQILALFETYGIHATWATVGFLFLHNRDELMKNVPEILPDYLNTRLSPYRYVAENDDIEREVHFAPDLIERARRVAGQEIATHTYSHYYCLESGQDARSFNADLAAAVAIARKAEIRTDSLVFPRNQWNAAYLPVLIENGIRCFRGNENSWLYQVSNGKNLSLAQRAFRLLDSYINISGLHTYSRTSIAVAGQPFNIPASRFLRPCGPSGCLLDNLRFRRIAKAMTDAARRGRIFHLWWHPHNFGRYTERNIALLRRILAHYTELRRSYGMVSMNMGEIAETLTSGVGGE